jgi:hypothetical protein
LRSGIAELSLQAAAEKTHLDRPDSHGGNSRCRNAEYPVPADVSGRTLDVLCKSSHGSSLAAGRVRGRHRIPVIHALSRRSPDPGEARQRG